MLMMLAAVVSDTYGNSWRLWVEGSRGRGLQQGWATMDSSSPSFYLSGLWYSGGGFMNQMSSPTFSGHVTRLKLPQCHIPATSMTVTWSMYHSLFTCPSTCTLLSPRESTVSSSSNYLRDYLKPLEIEE